MAPSIGARRAKWLSEYSMEKWRTEKGYEAPAHQDGNPRAQRRAGDDLDAQRHTRVRRQRLDFLECAAAVEGEDVGSGHRHEQQLQAERVIVEILLRMAAEEYDAEEDIPDVAGDPPRNEPMNGMKRDAFRHAERADVKKTDRTDQE